MSARNRVRLSEKVARLFRNDAVYDGCFGFPTVWVEICTFGAYTSNIVLSEPGKLVEMPLVEEDPNTIKK